MDIFQAYFWIGFLVAVLLFAVLYRLFRARKPMLAPLFTLAAGVVVIAGSIFVIGGFEGMPIGLAGTPFLIVGLLGFLFVYLKRR